MLKKSQGIVLLSLLLLSVPTYSKSIPVYLTVSSLIHDVCENVSYNLTEDNYIINTIVRDSYRSLVEASCYSGIIESTVIYNNRLTLHKDELRKACKNAQNYYNQDAEMKKYNYPTNLYSDCINEFSQNHNISIIEKLEDFK